MPKRASKKKMKEIVKTESLDLFMENIEIQEPNLEQQTNSIADLTEAITMIKRYEEIIPIKNRKVGNFGRRQEKLPKKVKDNQNFFETINQNKTKICFKINLNKFLNIYPVLKRFMLSSKYFKNNFKLIKIVCKTNLNLYRRQMILCITIVFFTFFPQP